MSWYFTIDGILKKKSKENIKNEKILEKLVKKTPKSLILACFIRPSGNKWVCEYFDKTSLTEFLSDEIIKHSEGVLQRFIDPNDSHNYVIKANWSPKFCFFEKIQNQFKLKDQSRDIYQRVVTFESETGNKKSIPLRGYYLPQQIEKLIFNISQHTSSVSSSKFVIERTEMLFKMDKKGKLWFLLASHVKFRNPGLKSPEENDNARLESIFTLPENLSLNGICNVAIKNVKKKVKCYNCDEANSLGSILSIPYSILIESWSFDHNKEIKKGVHKLNSLSRSISLEKWPNFNFQEKKKLRDIRNPDYFQIPPVIRLAEPKKVLRNFEFLKDDPSFLSKKAYVCESCYLLYTENSKYNNNLKTLAKREETKAMSFFGTEGLSPSKYKGRIETSVHKPIIRPLNPCKEIRLPEIRMKSRVKNNISIQSSKNSGIGTSTIELDTKCSKDRTIHEILQQEEKGKFKYRKALHEKLKGNKPISYRSNGKLSFEECSLTQIYGRKRHNKTQS